MWGVRIEVSSPETKDMIKKSHRQKVGSKMEKTLKFNQQTQPHIFLECSPGPVSH